MPDQTMFLIAAAVIGYLSIGALVVVVMYGNLREFNTRDALMLLIGWPSVVLALAVLLTGLIVGAVQDFFNPNHMDQK